MKEFRKQLETERRIHCCDEPVGDAHGQQEKGDDGVEESGHDVADGPINQRDQNIVFLLCRIMREKRKSNATQQSCCWDVPAALLE